MTTIDLVAGQGFIGVLFWVAFKLQPKHITTHFIFGNLFYTLKVFLTFINFTSYELADIFQLFTVTRKASVCLCLIAFLQ